MALGLDLGQNSIGWAIIDDYSNKTVESGVRIFPNFSNKQRCLARKKRSIENRTAQRILKLNKQRILNKKTNPIILTLIVGSFLTALFAIINFSNWQFWLNSFITMMIATLSLLYTKKKN